MEKSKLSQFISSMWRSKSYFFLVILSALVFLYLLFPFRDLSDFFAKQVLEGTGNQVYLEFEDLGVGVIPSPSVTMSQAKVSLTSFPIKNLKADEISAGAALYEVFAQVSFLKFMSRSSYWASARGLWGGEVNLATSQGKKTEDGSAPMNVEIVAEKLSLEQVKKAFDLPSPIAGDLNLESNLKLETPMRGLPESDFNLTVNKFKMAPWTYYVELMGGARTANNLPGMSLENILLKGRTENSKLFLDEVQLGKSGEALFGKMKGNIEFSSMGRMIPTRVQMTFDLRVLKSREQDFNDLLSGFRSFQKSSPSEPQYFRYNFSVNWDGQMPSFSAAAPL